MDNARLEDFRQIILKGQSLPDDLARLWTMQATRAPGSPSSIDPLAYLGARLIEPGKLPPLLSHSYLNEDDRANADIMRNIATFDEVFELTTFVVELEDTSIIGYWHGPEKTPIAEAPILMLDTEGQFAIIPGATLTEGLLGQALQYAAQSEFSQVVTWLSRYQIEIGVGRLDDLVEPPVAVLPSQVHLAAYNRRRVEDGLPEV